MLDSNEINAFALPGGYVYITRGLLGYLNSEAELAAVLGHEIGHVTARHGVRQVSSAQATSLGAGVLAVLVPELGQAGLGPSLDLLSTAVLRGYGRDHELEADGLGAEYLARAGYDASAMLDVIRVLKEHELLEQELAQLEGREARSYHGLFATHPDNDTRLQEGLAHARQQSTGGARRRDEYLARIDGLTFGPDTTRGVLESGRFLHAALGFAFDLPAGWQAQTQDQRLLASDPRQRAVLAMETRAAQGLSPAQVLSQASIGPLAQEEALSVDAYSGVLGLVQTTIGNRALPTRIACLVRDGQAIILRGIVNDPGLLGTFDPVFQKSIRSLRPLTPAERDRLRPLHLRVRRLEEETTWAALAAESPIRKLPEKQLRVLNAAQSAAVSPGKPIKLVN